MKWLWAKTRWIGWLLRKRKLNDELAEELALHLELQTEENIARGMNAADARAAARRQFGGVEQIKEHCRAQRTSRLADGLLRASRLAIRSLRTHPVYVTTCVIVLGISIAAVLTITAMVDALLVKPPSARAPEELVYVASSLPRGIVSFPDFKDLRERITKLSGVFGYQNPAKVSFVAGDQRVTGRCCPVSGNFFPTLAPICREGRLLTEEDDKPGSEPVVVLSTRLQSELAVKLQDFVVINRCAFRVVGILPSDFQNIDRSVRPEAWIALEHCKTFRAPYVITSRNVQTLRVGARKIPHVPLSEVDAELAVIAQQLQKENPEVNHGMLLGSRSFPGMRFADDESARTLAVIGGIVWVLFALGCTNFYALTLLRMFQRRREIAVRVALGATRGDLGQWIIGELLSVMALAFLFGGIVGYGLMSLLSFDPSVRALIDTAGVKIDWRTFGCTLGGASLALILTWWAVLRRATQTDIHAAIKESASAPRRHLAFRTLLAVQLALALVLVTISASFAETLWKAMHRSLPFRTQGLLCFMADFRALGWSSQQDKGSAFYQALMERLRTVPGVVDVALTNALPMESAGWTNISVDGRDPALEPDKGMVDFGVASSHLFSVLGVPLVAGRELTEEETAERRLSAVINQAMARRYWPNQDAIGKTFVFSRRVMTVVGVAADFPTGSESLIRPRFFRVFTEDNFSSIAVIALQVRDDTPAIRKLIRDTITSVWPDAKVPPVWPIMDKVQASWADLLTAVRIVLGIAGFAILVTACGLYFFSAYTTAQTMRDSAVRLVLGASVRNVAAYHLRRYAGGVGGGLLLGAMFLVALGPVLKRMNVSFTRPTVEHFVFAALIVLAMALLGLCVPLWKLKRLEPMATLRNE